jgi:hypothetical protein
MPKKKDSEKKDSEKKEEPKRKINFMVALDKCLDTSVKTGRPITSYIWYEDGGTLDFNKFKLAFGFGDPVEWCSTGSLDPVHIFYDDPSVRFIIMPIRT